MDIIINVIPLIGKLTGVGKYTYYVTENLVKNFDENYYFFVHGRILKDYKHLISSPKNERIKNFINKYPYLKTLLRKLIGVLAYKKNQIFDVYFEPNFVPLDLRAKKVISTVHDLSFMLYPQWHPKERVEFVREGFFKKTLKSDIIITPSKFIKNQLIEEFPSLENRVFSIHLGVDHKIFNPFPSNEVSLNFELPQKYILFVGSIEPRKNLLNLLKAYNILPEEIKKEYNLLLVGFEGWKNREIMDLIKVSSKYIKYLGYVPEKVLAEIYRRAYTFVYPSFYEGFGLPPLEAMACGCPVIVTKVASLPEVCGEAATYIENPHDIEEISFRLQQLMEDKELYITMKEKALGHAKKFNWEKTASEHYSLFKCV